MHTEHGKQFRRLFVTTSSLLTINEAAARLRISAYTLYSWASEGKLPVVRIGARAVRIRTEVVERIETQGLEPATSAA
jgi:excisionase family DNA binding protein